MLSFCQRDPRWADLKMGQSSLTIGRYGCTTSCIADLSTYYGDNRDPAMVSKEIQYTPGGLVIWKSCVFPHFEFDWREYGRNDEGIKKAIADPNRAVILQVNNGLHWVVATGRPTLLNRYFKIADPWLGDRADMSRYKDSITGAAYFKKRG